MRHGFETPPVSAALIIQRESLGGSRGVFLSLHRRNGRNADRPRPLGGQGSLGKAAGRPEGHRCSP